MINDLTNEDQELLISFPHTETALRYPSFWLRDHCPCPACTHPSTKQRQINTFDLDPFIKATDAESTPDGLLVTWSGEDTHQSLYPWEWLQTRNPISPKGNRPTTKSREWKHLPPIQSSQSASSYPQISTSYMDLTSTDPSIVRKAMRQLLSQIYIYGFAFIPSTPPTPEATEEMISLLGPIRHTHYGGFWDFTSVPSPIDTAYTDLALPLHTDNTYFTDPAGLQCFHLLSHTSPTDASAPGKGGESTFSDGFAAASYLYTANRAAYSMLATHPVISSAMGPDDSIGAFHNTNLHAAGHPILTHTLPVSPTNASLLTPQNLTQIRHNTPDRSVSTKFASHAQLKQWYTATRMFDRVLNSEGFKITVKLEPGTPVIFDNWRVLHGREAFEGKRRMCGAYVGMDDFLAKCRGYGVLGN